MEPSPKSKESIEPQPKFREIKELIGIDLKGGRN